MTLFLFLNLIIVTTRNKFITTPREGVNGQQYKQIETSQLVKTIWLKKDKTKSLNGGEGRGRGNNIILTLFAVKFC